ncbi:MAG TPA: alpha/beta hydrolase [Chitinophagaceae bacterium]
MESRFITYRHSRIHYLEFGTGTSYLFCFHGYGEDASSFRFLESALGHEFTLLAIDFPYHGQTEWNELRDFSPADLCAIINSIVPLELQTVSLIGYSMGGRIALSMIPELGKRLERVVLVAPDGLHRNFWYWLSTQTGAGNSLFRYTMEHPRWFFGGMTFLRSLGLLNKSIFRFAHSYLDNRNERMMLYQRWTCLRRFRPDQRAITRILKRYQVPLRMLFGSYDRIILSQRSTSLDRKNDTIIVRTIRAGHQLLKPKYARDIAGLFYE